jgi:hypothetical protein
VGGFSSAATNGGGGGVHNGPGGGAGGHSAHQSSTSSSDWLDFLSASNHSTTVTSGPGSGLGPPMGETGPGRPVSNSMGIDSLAFLGLHPTGVSVGGDMKKE